VIETHGYHAVKYRRIDLPSQRYTRDLVRAAIARKAVFIVMRARREWQRLVPELLEAADVFSLRSPQNGAVSSGNCPDAFPQRSRQFMRQPNANPCPGLAPGLALRCR
jgi:hypothetical protein